MLKLVYNFFLIFGSFDLSKCGILEPPKIPAVQCSKSRCWWQQQQGRRPDREISGTGYWRAPSRHQHLSQGPVLNTPAKESHLRAVPMQIKKSTSAKIVLSNVCFSLSKLKKIISEYHTVFVAGFITFNSRIPINFMT